MPIDKATRGGLTDKLAAIGELVIAHVNADKSLLYSIRDLAEAAKGDKKLAIHSHLVAYVVGLLSGQGEVAVEWRAGKLYVGAA